MGCKAVIAVGRRHKALLTTALLELLDEFVTDLAHIVEIDHLEPHEVDSVSLVCIMAMMHLIFVDILFLLVAISSLMFFAELL